MRAEKDAPREPLGSMAGFTFVWVGRLVSVPASNMSSFALTIWACQETGSATALGPITACFTVPCILVSPIAGTMVDRYNRKLMMMVSDLRAVLATTAILRPQGRGTAGELMVPKKHRGLAGIFAIGGVAGGPIISAWGGFEKRVRGMFLGWGVSGLLGLIGLSLGRSPAAWLPIAVVSAMAFPLSQSASDMIWQSRVAPDIQGRFFAARRMNADTWLAKTFAGITGTGPGSGKAIQFLLAGMLFLVIDAIALSIPAVHDVETLPPDHDQARKTPADAPATSDGGAG
jgi:MFS family permease